MVSVFITLALAVQFYHFLWKPIRNIKKTGVYKKPWSTEAFSHLALVSLAFVLYIGLVFEYRGPDLSGAWCGNSYEFVSWVKSWIKEGLIAAYLLLNLFTMLVCFLALPVIGKHFLKLPRLSKPV